MFTTLVGLVVALPALRLSGLYLALATMAFAQFTQWVLLNWESVTFGAGVKLPKLSVDYAFVGFSALEELGDLHRISFSLTLEQNKWKR